MKTINSKSSVEEAYEDYLHLAPLDINNQNIADFEKWKKLYQYSFVDFSILVSKLLQSRNLDNFIKQSSSDFDNLALVLKSCVRKEIIEILENGEVSPRMVRSEKTPNVSTREIIPKSEYNQFPCDEESVQRRMELFLERYPFSPETKIALIGDDDQISINLSGLGIFNIEVYEIDSNVIGRIEKLNNKNVNIRSIDLINQSPDNKNCDTFMTDPPYTLHGSLLFIARGLETLKINNKEKEFYVVLNKTMIGKNWSLMLKILSQANVELVEIRKNFSQYRLPKNFPEADRAKVFCRDIGIGEDNTPEYSSSSDLFIFRTVNPDIQIIKDFVNLNLIYNHYV